LPAGVPLQDSAMPSSLVAACNTGGSSTATASGAGHPPPGKTGQMRNVTGPPKLPHATVAVTSVTMATGFLTGRPLQTSAWISYPNALATGDQFNWPPPGKRKIFSPTGPTWQPVGLDGALQAQANATAHTKDGRSRESPPPKLQRR